MGRTLIKIAGLLLGVLLIIAAASKITAVREFASVIVQEIPMSREAGTISAVAITTLEFFSGVGFFFRRTRRPSAAIAAFLFLLFVMVIFHRITEGGEFPCNCFGVLGLQAPLVFHLLVDVALMTVAVLVFWRPTVTMATTRPHNLSSTRFPVTLLIVPATCALFLLWALLSTSRSPATASAPEEKKVRFDIAFPVKVSRVSRATLVKGVFTSGLLRPARVVDLVPMVNGQIVATTAYDGKKVAKGEIVAQIDKTEFRLAFERASSALLAAQIEYRTLSTSPFLQGMDTIQARRDLEAAREHFQRVRTAYAAGRIDGPALYRARREYETTRAYLSVNREDVIANRSGLAVAREAYERAKLELEATEIRAPFAGRIAAWDAAVGMQARPGHALCSLADVSGILIDVDIVEAEAGRIHAGDSTVISCMAFPGIRFPGIVRTLSPVIDVRTRMMKATVELSPEQPEPHPHRALLRPGMFASVLIETDRLKGRLLVSREALLMRDLRLLVFTMEQGLAKWHYIETGEENQEFVEVLSGIAEGDTVVVEGHQALAHDARIFVKE
jgi:RND family efflux transporter MFP subunit